MLIILRQPNIDISASYKDSLSIKEAAFMRCECAEVFEYGVEFLPLKDLSGTHQLIKKVHKDCWEEPNTGLVYEFLHIVPPSWLKFIPKHLELVPPPC